MDTYGITGHIRVHQCQAIGGRRHFVPAPHLHARGACPPFDVALYTAAAQMVDKIRALRGDKNSEQVEQALGSSALGIAQMITKRDEARFAEGLDVINLILEREWDGDVLSATRRLLVQTICDQPSALLHALNWHARNWRLTTALA